MSKHSSNLEPSISRYTTMAGYVHALISREQTTLLLLVCLVHARVLVVWRFQLSLAEPRTGLVGVQTQITLQHFSPVSMVVNCCSAARAASASAACSVISDMTSLNSRRWCTSRGTASRVWSWANGAEPVWMTDSQVEVMVRASRRNRACSCRVGAHVCSYHQESGLALHTLG